jgi:hypothetical protein
VNGLRRCSTCGVVMGGQPDVCPICTTPYDADASPDEPIDLTSDEQIDLRHRTPTSGTDDGADVTDVEMAGSTMGADPGRARPVRTRPKTPLRPYVPPGDAVADPSPTGPTLPPIGTLPAGPMPSAPAALPATGPAAPPPPAPPAAKVQRSGGGPGPAATSGLPAGPSAGPTTPTGLPPSATPPRTRPSVGSPLPAPPRRGPAPPLPAAAAPPPLPGSSPSAWQSPSGAVIEPPPWAATPAPPGDRRPLVDPFAPPDLASLDASPRLPTRSPGGLAPPGTWGTPSSAAQLGTSTGEPVHPTSGPTPSVGAAPAASPSPSRRGRRALAVVLAVTVLLAGGLWWQRDRVGDALDRLGDAISGDQSAAVVEVPGAASDDAAPPSPAAPAER